MPEEEKQERVNVYDDNAVKQIMDDWVRKVVLKRNPQEDFTISNCKILIGGISCLLGVYAHYYVGPWGTNARIILTFCVLAFALLQLVLKYIAHFVEKDFIINIASKRPYKVRTAFSKETGNYEIEIVDKQTESSGSPKSYKTSKSITEYFDQTGLFYGNILELHIIEALDKFVEKVNQ
eukprot:TRINITY_DN14135_c0_g1_i1.p1 TRINITY_DN14135_c0_g1~~TRINITY_DN14135_c0_g1_i1.p1  ORF type:complete len:179 (+),score=35.18 TRINITY_DN14135_c0_g1_i1:310-846(+)